MCVVKFQISGFNFVSGKSRYPADVMRQLAILFTFKRPDCVVSTAICKLLLLCKFSKQAVPHLLKIRTLPVYSCVSLSYL